MSPDDYPCDCGVTHTSLLAAIYCREQIEADDRAARKPAHRDTRPERYYLSED